MTALNSMDVEIVERIDNDWLQKERETFVRHPRDIVSSAIPLSELCEVNCNGGVYFLINEKRIVYVGMSDKSVKTRILSHSKKMPFDAFSVIPLVWHGDLILMVESLYIGWLRPWFNGKLQAVPTLFADIPLETSISDGPTEEYMYQGGYYEIDSKRTVSRTASKKIYSLGCEDGKGSKTASFRLSEACIEMIKKLAEDKGVSQSAVIELAVREEHKKNERKKK